MKNISESIDRGTFIKQLGTVIVTSGLFGDIAANLLFSSQDESLEKKIVDMTNGLARSANVSIDTQLTQIIATNLMETYEHSFFEKNMENIARYIVSMNQRGWTQQKYSAYKKRFEAKLKRAIIIPDNVLKKSIAIGFDTNPVFTYKVGGSTEQIFINFNFFPRAYLYLFTAEHMAEHELRHYGLRHYCSGSFVEDDYAELMMGEMISRYSDTYASRFNRVLKDDLTYISTKYKNIGFENEHKTTVIEYYTEEVMIVATGDIDLSEQRVDADEKLGMRLNVTATINYINFHPNTMIAYAKDYSIIKSLGATTENSDAIKVIDQKVEKSGIREDFDLVVNIFELIFEMANKDYKEQFRLYE